MKTELVDLSPTRKEIKIEIEPAQIRTAYDRISERYAKGASVPGFRRGHAPRSVVRTRFKSEIRSDVLRELLPDAVNTAIGEHSLATIGEPDVHLDNTEALENLGEEPITVKVGVEVFPEVKLEKYKGLDAVRRTRPVTDEDVDKMIEGLRDASASLQPVEDRGAEAGDTVTINVQGKFVDAPDEEDIKADDIEVVLGGEGVQQEFTDNLQNTKPDDTKSFLSRLPCKISLQKDWPGRKLNTRPTLPPCDGRNYPRSTTNGRRAWVTILIPSRRSVEDSRRPRRQSLQLNPITACEPKSCASFLRLTSLKCRKV